jgi:hypothetical protein
MSIGDLPMRRIREWGPAPAPASLFQGSGQAPCGPGALGRIRNSITILAGKKKLKLIIFSLSLGQALPA